MSCHQRSELCQRSQGKKLNQASSPITIIEEGNPQGPLLICIHGLMGGPSDFDAFREEWGKQAHLLLVDISKKAREDGGLKQIHKGEELMSFHETSDHIASFVKKKYPGHKVFIAGISLGGKVIYDFAADHPDLFGGGVVTDVGPGSLGESELVQFVEKTLPSINLMQAWPQLRSDLREKIPEPKMRVLISSQIYYPEEHNQIERKYAAFKPSISGLQTSLNQSSLNDQWDQLNRIKKEILILKASKYSCIQERDLWRLKQHRHIKLIELDSASHFIHVSHGEVFKKEILNLLKNI